jgi:hypothetical protein
MDLICSDQIFLHHLLVSFNGFKWFQTIDLPLPLLFEDLTFIRDRQKAIEIISSDPQLQSSLNKVVKDSEGVNEILHYFHQFSGPDQLQSQKSLINVNLIERKFKVLSRIKNALNAVEILNSEVKLNDMNFLKQPYEVSQIVLKYNEFLH